MYIYIYIYVCVCVCVYMYTDIYARIPCCTFVIFYRSSLSMSMLARTGGPAGARAATQGQEVSVCTYIHEHMYVYIYKCIFTYIYLHIYI